MIFKADFNTHQTERTSKVRIGVFGVGYFKYWEQFPGLYEDLMNKQAKFISKFNDKNVSLIDFGMVDTPKMAYDVLKKIESSNLDFIFCDMLTYATSGTFGIIIKSLSIPVVLVALQPLRALDYSQATTYMQLSNDDICSLPEFAGVAVRMGKAVPEMIIGTLDDDDEADQQIDEYCRIARVLHDLKNVHLGHMGHPINAMLDMHTDATMLTSFFGSHIVQCEANELMKSYDSVTEEEIADEENKILDFFDTPNPVSDPISMKLTPDDLHIYYDGAEDSELRKVMSNLIVGNSLLTAKHIPMCGESDLKTLIALLIFDRLDIGGSFAEFHPVDFEEGFVLVGHDGPHNISIADGKPVLRSLKKYHGKPGRGAGVEFKIKEGPITMLSVSSTYEGKFKFVIAEGESVKGPIPATGNTNTRGFFKPDVKTFLKSWMKEGPTHHFALGTGHHAGTIEKIASYLGIESKIVTRY